MAYFYSHLIEIETLVADLDQMDLSEAEKKDLALLADGNIHNAVLDAIFSELTPQEKIVFLNHLKNNDHDKIWKLLNERVDRIEEKIKKTAEDVKSELKTDIKEAKRIKNDKS